MDNIILSSYTLPCGTVLKNRAVKAAMTERLATKEGKVTQELIDLYTYFNEQDSAVLISGNIMIDKKYRESGANIVLEDDSDLSRLKKMTAAGTQNGVHFWAQINHPGRQAPIFSTFRPLAPSAIKLKKLMLFAKPKALTLEQIKNIADRFVNTAKLCKKGGFTGVQIHSAHGYLLSQFLSPRTNIREDEYGGSIENRGRLLFDIIKRLRIELGADYPISVKVNSADFQRGGFEESDAMKVVMKLDKLGIDLLEISGGTYENTEFFNRPSSRESTRKREAYFMDFADKIRANFKIPLLVTGGFRTAAFCNEVLQKNALDMIGFARPFILEKDFLKRLVKGIDTKIEEASFHIKIKQLKDIAEGGYYDKQITLLAKGKEIKPNYNSYLAVLRLTKDEMIRGWF